MRRHIALLWLLPGVVCLFAWMYSYLFEFGIKYGRFTHGGTVGQTTWIVLGDAKFVYSHSLLPDAYATKTGRPVVADHKPQVRAYHRRSTELRLASSLRRTFEVGYNSGNQDMPGSTYRQLYFPIWFIALPVLVLGLRLYRSRVARRAGAGFEVVHTAAESSSRDKPICAPPSLWFASMPKPLKLGGLAGALVAVVLLCIVASQHEPSGAPAKPQTTPADAPKSGLPVLQEPVLTPAQQQRRDALEAVRQRVIQTPEYHEAAQRIGECTMALREAQKQGDPDQIHLARENLHHAMSAARKLIVSDPEYIAVKEQHPTEEK